mmetsp:Transcript_9218/g.20897  ORF Transcript_9218/g.20897 Transcript_9218/m.20897 type:complete len:204 (-) Transcript_9218:463-1074(-)
MAHEQRSGPADARELGVWRPARLRGADGGREGGGEGAPGARRRSAQAQAGVVRHRQGGGRDAASTVRARGVWIRHRGECERSAECLPCDGVVVPASCSGRRGCGRADPPAAAPRDGEADGGRMSAGACRGLPRLRARARKVLGAAARTRRGRACGPHRGRPFGGRREPAREKRGARGSEGTARSASRTRGARSGNWQRGRGTG